jgi:hypothetical protein
MDIRNSVIVQCGLTMKAEPRPTKDVNREGGTGAANGRWFRRLVRPQVKIAHYWIEQRHDGRGNITVVSRCVNPPYHYQRLSFPKKTWNGLINLMLPILSDNGFSNHKSSSDLNLHASNPRHGNGRNGRLSASSHRQ